MPITLQVSGTPRPLAQDAGLTVYRTVQEALTNVAKHAGRGAHVAVRLTWAPASVAVAICDSGGDRVDAELPSSRLGLTAMAERAALLGGQLDARHTEHGFEVKLRLPVHSPEQERSDVAC